MIKIARRTVLAFAAALPATAAHAVNALPDTRFVGYAQAVNDFEIGAAKLTLAKSMNDGLRGFAANTRAAHIDAAEDLRRARSEAGVIYAPDPSDTPNTIALLKRLSLLEGAEYDYAYVDAQLAVLTDADLQYGAYSQNGASGVLRRYAQREWPKARGHLVHAQRLAGAR